MQVQQRGEAPAPPLNRGPKQAGPPYRAAADTVYRKDDKDGYRPAAESYLAQEVVVLHQATRRGFWKGMAIATPIATPILTAMASSTGLSLAPSLALGVGGGVCFGLMGGLIGSAAAQGRDLHQFQAEHSRPVLEVAAWDTYLDPHHNLIVLDDLRV